LGAAHRSTRSCAYSFRRGTPVGHPRMTATAPLDCSPPETSPFMKSHACSTFWPAASYGRLPAHQPAPARSNGEPYLTTEVRAHGCSCGRALGLSLAMLSNGLVLDVSAGPMVFHQVRQAHGERYEPALGACSTCGSSIGSWMDVLMRATIDCDDTRHRA
jgi:hypothetical protein